jgi:WD40 repeat protein
VGVNALDIALSLDGGRLYAADAEGSAGVFSTNPDPRLGDPGPLEVLAPRMNTVAAGPGGRVAWADGGERVFIADTASRAGATPLVVAPGQQIHIVRFSPDGTLIAAGTHQGQLVLASAAGGTIRWTRGAGTKGAGYSGLRFSADGATIAASRRDGTVEFIPIADPDRAVSIKASARMLRGMDLAPDGTHLATVGNAGELVMVHSSGEVFTSPRLSEDDLFAVACHPGGMTIAVGDRGGNVILVDTQTLSTLATLTAGDAVMALQFDATGRTLFVSTLNRPIERWDLSSLVEPLPRVRPRTDQR